MSALLVAVFAICLIVYYKVLLCSGPTLLCRDNHSREEACNLIGRLGLWHSYLIREQEAEKKNPKWQWKYCEINILHRHTKSPSGSPPPHPLPNTDYRPSVMWMICRPVLKRSSVRPIAAICTYMLSIMLLPEENIPIASTSWWFNKKVND